MSGVDESQREAWRAMQVSRGHRTAEPELPLYGGGGGGTLPPMDSVKYQIEAVEARTDTKFSELRRDMDSFATRSTVWGGVGATIAAIVTAVGVLLAVIAFGGDRFDAGVSAGGALSPYAEQQRSRDTAQDKKLDEILRRLPPPSDGKAT